jgi:hypothetical protein
LAVFFAKVPGLERASTLVDEAETEAAAAKLPKPNRLKTK